MVATPFHHIALIGKYQSQQIGDLLELVAGLMQQHGIEFVIESQTAFNTGLEKKYPYLTLEEIRISCDLAIVIGGDGTMINAARELSGAHIPMVGINKGRLGFITDIPAEHCLAALEPILAGQFREESRSMICAKICRDGKPIYEAQALNEVAVNRGGMAGMIEVNVHVDDVFVANFRSDGVIIATPTGSTAYALAAGGPILAPSIQGWVLVPIAAHTLSNRPIVLPDTGMVTLEISAAKKASATFDTQSFSDLYPLDRITLQRAKDEIRFLHPPQWSFYETLRGKLRWYSGH